MLKAALEVLKIIEKHHFECFIVGGFVRDYYLGIKSEDVDICTNAKAKDILEIFPNSKIPKEIYGSITLFYNDVRFEITTYRREIRYENRKPIEIEYTNSLMEDLKRRDFTANALCMNSRKQIIDLLNGKKDIDSKTLKLINKPNISLKEDPLRILRAIRFSAQLDFNLDKELIKGIKKNKKYLDNLSFNRKMGELNKIIVTKNNKKGLELLRKMGLDKQLKLYDINKLVYVSDLIGYWVQLDKDNVYEYTIYQKENIQKVREILKSNKIDNKTLFKYGLYICSVAADIMKKDKEEITKRYSELVIKSNKEIKISGEEILNIVNKKPGKWVKDIMDDVTDNILDKKLENDTETLKNYIMDKYMV